MAFNTYNNNDQDKPTSVVYSPISFTNPESTLQQTRFAITYFNRMMQISIAQRNVNDTTTAYPTFDNNNAVKVYLSFHKAKMLCDELKRMFHTEKSDIHNVCIETKNGLFKVSDGSEYNSPSPVISILYMVNGNTAATEVLYQCKNNYEIAYNYKDGSYSTHKYPSLEIDTFIMILEEYYKASSYAIAASVNESSMYHEKFVTDTIRSIAGKVGAVTGGGSGSYKTPNQNSFNNHSFLSNNTNNVPVINEFDNNVPKEYQQSSFDDIVNGMMGSE